MRSMLSSGPIQHTTTRINQYLITGWMILVILKAIDGFWTMWAVNNGYVEINPVMAPIASTWLEPVITISPITAFGLIVLWGKNRLPVAEKSLLVGLIIGCVIMACVLISNLMEVIS